METQLRCLRWFFWAVTGTWRLRCGGVALGFWGQVRKKHQELREDLLRHVEATNLAFLALCRNHAEHHCEPKDSAPGHGELYDFDSADSRRVEVQKSLLREVLEGFEGLSHPFSQTGQNSCGFPRGSISVFILLIDILFYISYCCYTVYFHGLGQPPGVQYAKREPKQLLSPAEVLTFGAAGVRTLRVTGTPPGCCLPTPGRLLDQVLSRVLEGRCQ